MCVKFPKDQHDQLQTIQARSQDPSSHDRGEGLGSIPETLKTSAAGAGDADVEQVSGVGSEAMG